MLPPIKKQKQQANTAFGGGFSFGAGAHAAPAGKPAPAPASADEDAATKPRFNFSFGQAGTATATGTTAGNHVAKPRRTLAPSAQARYGAGLGGGAADEPPPPLSSAAAAGPGPDSVPPLGGGGSSMLRYSTSGVGLPPATLRPSAMTGGHTATASGLSYGASRPSTLGASSAAAGATATATATAPAAAAHPSSSYAPHPRSTTSSYGSTAGLRASAGPTAQMQSLQQRAAAVGVSQQQQQQQQQTAGYGSRVGGGGGTAGLFSSRPSSQQPQAPPPATPPDAVVRGGAAAAANHPRAPAAAPASPAPSSARTRAATPTPRPLLPTGTYLDVLTWRDAGRSGAHLALGLLALAAAAGAAYYPHGVSGLTAVACLGMLDLAVNFARFFTPFSDRARLRWAGSAALDELSAAAAGLVRSLGAAHDRWLSASDPSATLRAAVALWGAAVVGTLGLPPLALAAGAWVALFTVPWALLTQGRRARALRRALLRAPVAGPALAAVEAAAGCMRGMPRVSRLLGTVVGLAALAGWTRSWPQVAAGVFACACQWRTALAPAEIESIRSAAEPWTQSVRKMGNRLSAAMEDAFAGGGPGGGASASYVAAAAGGAAGRAVGSSVGMGGGGGGLAARVAAGRSYY